MAKKIRLLIPYTQDMGWETWNTAEVDYGQSGHMKLHPILSFPAKGASLKISTAVALSNWPLTGRPYNAGELGKLLAVPVYK